MLFLAKATSKLELRQKQHLHPAGLRVPRDTKAPDGDAKWLREKFAGGTLPATLNRHQLGVRVVFGVDASSVVNKDVNLLHQPTLEASTPSAALISHCH